jgi:hypothetical protein
MSILRVKTEIIFEYDTLNYPIPADGNVRQTLEDELSEAICASMSIDLESVKVSSVKKVEE